MKPEAQRIAIAEAYYSGNRYVLQDGFFYQLFTEYCPQPFSCLWEGGRGYLVQVYLPDYLNDMNAAVEFARYMGTQGWRCACNMGTGGAWECQFHRAWQPSTNPDNVAWAGKEKLEEHYGAADTLAPAICQAGLSALGKWVE